MGAVGNEAGAPPHAWHDWAPIDRSNLSTNVSDHRLPAGRWMASSNGLTWQGGESRGKAYDTEYLKSVLLGETDELGGWKKESHLPPLEERPQDLLRKGAWTDDEDQILREHVATMGEKDWNRIKMVYGLQRSGKSCRLRYMNHLRPNLKKERFTGAELRLVMQLQSRYGNKWALIANHFKGRTDNEVKNAWHTRRRQMERERRKTQKWQAAEQSGACTASCGSDVIDGPGCATSSLCAMGGVHSHGSQELFCSQQLPGRQIDFPATNHGAEMKLDVPVTHTGLVLPHEGYPGPWNLPLYQWPDYPVSDSCSPQPQPPADFTGRPRLAPLPKTQSSGSLSTVHSCTPVPYCHVATLERAASTVTDASEGLVIDGPAFSSFAAPSFGGDSGETGARPEESVCSVTWPFEAARLEDPTPFPSEPALGASSPGTKLHLPAPPRLVIPDSETDHHDASWADNVYLSPIGPFPTLSPVKPLQSHSSAESCAPLAPVGLYRSDSQLGVRQPNAAGVGPYRSQTEVGVQSLGGPAPWTSAQFSLSEAGWSRLGADDLDPLLTSRRVELSLEELGVLNDTLATYSEWPVIAPSGSCSDWTVTTYGAGHSGY